MLTNNQFNIELYWSVDEQIEYPRRLANHPNGVILMKSHFVRLMASYNLEVELKGKPKLIEDTFLRNANQNGVFEGST